MTWIRNPWWDGFWLLSGLPIGLAITGLVWAGIPWFWVAAAGVIVFQTAHTIAPIALAWSHSGFRAIMRDRPVKFVAIPLAILLSWTIIGWIAGLFWRPAMFDPMTFKLSVDSHINPIWIMGTIYAAWNIYHFGKQNFGVMSIYRIKSSLGAPMGDAYSYSASKRPYFTSHSDNVLRGRSADRRADLIFCCTMTWAAMAVPTVRLAANWLRWDVLRFQYVLGAYVAVAVAGIAVMLWFELQRFCLPRVILILTNGIGMGSALFWGLGGLAIISINHWLTAVGLAGHVRGRPLWFPVIVIVLGMLLFGALFIRGWHIPTQIGGAVVGFRLALGIVHFLYDRWVWKFSDPRVRATIGCDLFHRPADGQQKPLASA